jgi:hypothetical protein
MALLDPEVVTHGGDGASLDAAADGINRSLVADLGAGEVAAFRWPASSSPHCLSVPWLPFIARSSEAFVSMYGCAMPRWRPMASMLNIAASSTGFGIAMISLGFSAKSICPGTKGGRAGREGRDQMN